MGGRGAVQQTAATAGARGNVCKLSGTIKCTYKMLSTVWIRARAKVRPPLRRAWQGEECEDE